MAVEEQIPAIDVYDIRGQQPVKGTLDPSEVHNAISSGNFSFPKGASVPVIAPDGTQGTIDAAEAPQAFQSGYKYATPELQDQAKYGTTEQMIKTGLEGVAKGALGPLATGAERVFGVKPEDIRKRAEVNPITHGVGEVAGFGGSLLTGEGIAPIIGKLGEAASGATGLAEAGTTIAKIAQSGVQVGTEMAALQAGDEISKALTEQPGQTLGSAAIDIGLSGILGSAGGIALGSVAPLWKTATNKSGVEKVINDFQGRTQLLNDMKAGGGDLASKSVEDVSRRIAETQEMIAKQGAIKGESIAASLPASTPENLAKVDEHLQEIFNRGQKMVDKATGDAYLGPVAKKMGQDLNEFAEVVTNPEATIGDKWDALNTYKQKTQGHADYNWSATKDEKAVSKWIKPYAASLREAGENTKIWGDAGDVQKITNKGLSGLYDAQKDFMKVVTTGGQVDPNKITNLINAAAKGKAELKVSAVNNYLKATEDASQAFKKAHELAGIDAPMDFRFNPTAALDAAINSPQTLGSKLADLLHEKGSAALAKSAGETGGAVAGSLSGLLVGHPLIGGVIGEKLLSPIFNTMAKPFAEKAMNSEAAKATITALSSAIKGELALNKAAIDLFKGPAMIIPQHMMPSQSNRDKLQKSLDYMNKDPQNMVTVGGKLGHYMPNHGVEAGKLASTAVKYLNTLKPGPAATESFDTTPPRDKIAEAQYNRALDIAQNPLLVLQHVKDGTLQAQDVLTLNTIYPDLHTKMIGQIQQEMINAKAEGINMPYNQRAALSSLLGHPVDSTQTPRSMQAIIHSVQGFTPPAMPQEAKSSHKVSTNSMKSMEKVNSLYQTPLQARAAHRGMK